MSNEEIIWTYLNDKLKNEYGTAAMMGNLFAESSLNPINATGNKHGLTNQQYTDVVDQNLNDNFNTDGVAYGLAQWRYHTRKQGLLKLARERKVSIGNINMQLDYLWQELQSYKTVLNALLNAANIRDASDVVLLRYEKPAGTSEAVKQKRAKYGQKYYDKYSKDSIKTTVNRSAAAELKDVLERIL